MLCAPYLTPRCGHRPRRPTSQHKDEKNFNFNNVRAVTILGDRLEGSMVVRGMAFGGCVFVLSPVLPTTSDSFMRFIGEQA